MPFSFRPVMATVLACGLSLPAMAQEQATADTVIATVGDVEITAGHLASLRAQLPEQYQAMPDSQLYEGLLDQLVQQTALAAQLEEPSDTVRRILENEQRALYASVVIQAIAAAAVTEEKLRAAYETEYANAAPTPEYNASHILVDDEAAATEIAELLKGDADFAELAKARSTGPSGPSGGELGWFGPGMMVPQFEEAVVALEPGQVSAPVQTQFGWHVIKLNDSRVQSAASFESVQGELAEKIQTDAVQARIAEAMEATTITKKSIEDVDPAFLSNPALFDE